MRLPSLRRYIFPILLFIFVFIKAFFAYHLIVNYIIGLSPDEAQYWVWSKHLSLGYYSKSPGIAWMIALTTHFLGDNELGVRLGALIFSSLLTVSTYFIIRFAGIGRRYAFWGALIQMLSPMGVASSFAATTDVPMLFFWTIALAYLFKKLASGFQVNYIYFGLILAMGAFFKWPQIYFLWIVATLAFIFRFREARNFFQGFVLSFIGLLPSLIWNIQNDWATFRHIFGQISGGSISKVFEGNLIEFCLGQLALLSPVYFILMLLAILVALFSIRAINIQVRLALLLTVLLFSLAVFRSSYKNVQANWFLMIYPAAFVVMMWYVENRLFRKRLWLYGGLMASLLLTIFAISVPFLQSRNIIYIPYKVNAFQQSLGGKELEKTFILLDREGADFFFSDNYQDVSLASFYSARRDPIYFFNISGARKNQYDFWYGMGADLKGKDGIFFFIENGRDLDGDTDQSMKNHIIRLKGYFKEVDYIRRESLFISNLKEVKQVTFLYCSDYNGEVPPEVEIF